MKHAIKKSVIGTLAILACGALPSTTHADFSALWDCKGITIDQVGPATVSVGGQLDYEIRIKNGGNCDLSGSSVVDFIPRMSVFHEASPQPTDFPNAPNTDIEHPVSKIGWKDVTLGAGKEIYFKISANVRGPEDRVLLNTACFENALSGRICSQAETVVTKN